MERLFRESAFLRPKWEEEHHADGATYGEWTIERAIITTSETYNPGQRDCPVPGLDGDRDGTTSGWPEGATDRVAYPE